MIHDDFENPSTIIDSQIPLAADGTATLTVEPGKYDFLRLEHDDYIVTPFYTPRDVTASFEISAGTNDTLAFTLHSKVNAHGTVINVAKGQPVKGVYVSAQTSNRPATNWFSFGGGETDADGHYELEVPAGPVRLSTSGDNLTMGKSFLETEIRAGGSTVLPEIQLRPTPKIVGRVVDPTGNPVAGAIIRLRGSYFGSRNPPVMSGANGEFQIEVSQIPADWETNELVWTHHVDAFHPQQAISARRQLRLDQPESLANLVITLQPESCEMFLARAKEPTAEWARKREAQWKENGHGATRESLHGQLAPALDGALWLNTVKPTMSLVYFRGKYVLLDFWTVWCGPCHVDFPDVKLLHETYKDHGLVVIGVHDNSVDAESVREHAKQQGLTFPIVVDERDGRTVAEYKRIGAVSGYPNYVLIGPDGKIVQTNEISDFKFEYARKYLFGNGQLP
jgi:thiol-disulfide isomerase/thioredoxin